MSTGLFVERLALASLEITALAAIVLLAVLVLRIRSPRLRALLLLLVLVKPLVTILFGAVVPVIDVNPPWPSRTGTPGNTAIEWNETTTTVPNATRTAFGVVGNTASPVTRTPVRAALLIWSLGVLGGVALSVIGRYKVCRLVGRGLAAPPSIGASCRRIAAELGLSRSPGVVVSRELESPALVGTFAPRVVLPAWIVEEARENRVEWSLRHELTHYKHRDPLAALVVEAARIVLFFHPLVWWLAARWRDATEMACDRALVRTEDAAVAYADQLYDMIVNVRNRRRHVLASSLFATRTQIGRRIEALLRAPVGTAPGLGRLAGVVLAVAATAVLAVGADVTPEAIPGHDVTVRAKQAGKNALYALVDADEDGRVVRLKIRGRVELSNDYRDVLALSEEASLELEEDDTHHKRFVEVTRGDDGRPAYHYEVDRKDRVFDDEAREWFARVLRKYWNDIDPVEEWRI